MRYVRLLLMGVAVFGLAASLGYIVFQPEEHDGHDHREVMEVGFDADPRPAPAFTVETLDGETFSSEEREGEIIVLDFWATWCGPCITEIPHYNSLDEEYEGQGVHLLGITLQSGAKEDVVEFASSEETRITYPLAMGTDEIVDDYGPIWGFPMTLLIDQDRRIVKTWLGAAPNKTPQLRYLIEKLLEEGPVPQEGSP